MFTCTVDRMSTPALVPQRIPQYIAMELPADAARFLHERAFETGYSKVALVARAIRLACGPGDMLSQALLDATQYRKLMGDCQCECGQPCQACVIDAQRLREYRAALAILGVPEPLT
jgi:hypothetical protein